MSEDGFHWLGDYEITADEVLGGIAPKANKLEQAKRLLREVAETNNAMQSNEIFNIAEEQGISRRTLENAKKELSIRVSIREKLHRYQQESRQQPKQSAKKKSMDRER